MAFSLPESFAARNDWSDIELWKENMWWSLQQKNDQLKQNTETKEKLGKTFP